MADQILYPRYTRARLEEALADTPVVLVHGPRQCGKTTLARLVGDAAGYTYITFDNDVQLAAARYDPVGFVADLPARVVLDEVQRAPELFLALKSTVDRERTAGRFILTGSTNVLFGEGWPNRSHERLGSELLACVAAGGYPGALARTSERRRTAWYRDYVETLIQRDVRDLARISSLDVLPRLLQLAASQTARLLNVTEMAGPFQLSRPTIRDYVKLLERAFLLEHLPPWHSNRLSRLVKSPKLHIGDTGVAAALLGLDSAALAKDRTLFGQLLETFVFQELRRQASWYESSIAFYHFRDRDDAEVDIVLERSINELAGIEVKAAATVGEADFRGLRKLQAVAGDRFVAGVVLYDGLASVGFGPKMFAVPIRALWEATTRGT